MKNYVWKFLRKFYTPFISCFFFINSFPISCTWSATSTLQKNFGWKCVPLFYSSVCRPTLFALQSRFNAFLADRRCANLFRMLWWPFRAKHTGQRARAVILAAMRLAVSERPVFRPTTRSQNITVRLRALRPSPNRSVDVMRWLTTFRHYLLSILAPSVALFIPQTRKKLDLYVFINSSV